MKKMRRLSFISLLLIAAMVFSACSSPKPSTPSVSPSEDPQLSDTDAPDNQDSDKPGTGKKIGILPMRVADEFINAVYKAADARAKELGFETVLFDPKDDAALQASAAEDMLSQGIDAIIMAPVDSSALSDTVAKINEKGIPLTLIDRSVESGHYVAACEADNVKCGYQGGIQLVEAAKKAGLKVEDLKVLELQGDLASSSGLDRTKGFKQAADELGFKIVSSLPTYWNTDTAYNAALDALQANPDINAVFLASDGVMGDAVINAFEQVGRLKAAGEEGHIIVSAVDGTPGVLDAIRKGYVDVTISQPAIVMGQTAVDKIVDAMTGKAEVEADEYIGLEPVIGTIDNVDSGDLWGNAGKSN